MAIKRGVVSERASRITTIAEPHRKKGAIIRRRCQIG
jgi:hypothetical protein